MKTVSKIPYVTGQRAAELISGAKRSTASETGPVTGNLIKAAVGQILYLKAAVKEQVKLLIQQTLSEIRNQCHTAACGV